jgi:putative ABC transport system ATP-binding protein
MSAPCAEPIVKVTVVRKAYGSATVATPALCDLTLEVARGAFVSVMGPSGSGKSTLLNLIAGLDQPDAGSVEVDGVDLGRLSDRRLSALRLRKIGFVFQSFNLIPALTVVENVEWPLRFSGYSRSESHRRAHDVLSRVQMSGREGRRPAELSGGEQQRVAIARAIATGPILLLADEPTGNLDSVTGRMVLDLLRRLNQEEAMTVIMVTHNVFAASYGDRTVEVRDGRIVRDVCTPARGVDAQAAERAPV